MDLNALNRFLPNRLLQQRVRKLAVRRVRKREEELSAEDLEYLLADAEKDVRAELKQASLLGALALLGINLF